MERHYQTMDGNTAAAYISYAFTEVAAIYPITPSSPMAEMVDEWAVQGKTNIFGHPVRVNELQSEAGAAAAVHGALKAGALTTTYTASQGLLLMIPNMYKIAGELLPAVFHVASRTVATNALSIFGDHSDVMATRQTGFAILVENSVQEVMDLSAVAHLSALKGRLPFINMFDGFKTSHEMQKIEVIDYEDLAVLFPYESYREFQERKMNPNHPTVSGSVQNPDIHFQQRELVNRYYDELPNIVSHYMEAINDIRGTNYGLVNYYGDPEATRVIIAMGSVIPTIQQVVDELNQHGEKVGVMSIHLYRPFPTEALLQHMPSTVQHIAVLDRTKEPGADGEPLLQDVRSAFYHVAHAPRIIGGRYGISSKDVTPDQIVSVYDALNTSDHLSKSFTIGICDDVTHLSLPQTAPLDLTSPHAFQAKFYGYGSDGTVGATKQAIKIIGNHTDQYVQGYFVYDSRKSGGVTVSHMRVSPTPIRSSYLIQHSDFVACHNAAYLYQYDMLDDIKQGGTFVLNTQWDKTDILTHLPNKVKRQIAKKQLKFYVIDAFKLAQSLGMQRHINTIMERIFFDVTQIIDCDLYVPAMKDAVVAAYQKKSQAIVNKNHQAIDAATAALEQVIYPVEEWAALDALEKATSSSDYKNDIVSPMLKQQGDHITLSTMQRYHMEDGTLPMGTTKYEKRGSALEVPQWDSEKCTQCNECAFVCPHAAIRPIVMDEVEQQAAPDGMIVRELKGEDGLYYRIQVSVEDCTGCHLCVKHCPSDALHMQPYHTQKEEAMNWCFAMTVKQKTLPTKKQSIISTQWKQPLLEFSGACQGCGETAYVKLLTQLYGDRLMIANATGCSSIWGSSAPMVPYTTDEHGHGPAWSNSLLEDAAEYGFGMYQATMTKRQHLAEQLQHFAQCLDDDQAKTIIMDWVEHLDDSEGTCQRAEKLATQLHTLAKNYPEVTAYLEKEDMFVKQSQWMIGGDGWAYDIGYGGVDHILSTGADVNMLVLDNEVYANTGGQTSKATPTAAIAKFSAGGKHEAKKDLGQMAMVYPNVYVAQISLDANPVQALKAIEEAEKHKGPSLIIAYVPCIAHGIKGGMVCADEEAKVAVESGYWSLYRYQPEKRQLQLDYKRPDFDKINDFLLMQTRFSSLQQVDPDIATELYHKIKDDAMRRFFVYADKAGIGDRLRQKLGNEPVTEYNAQNEDDKIRRRKEREARRQARKEQKNMQEKD